MGFFFSIAFNNPPPIELTFNDSVALPDLSSTHYVPPDQIDVPEGPEVVAQFEARGPLTAEKLYQDHGLFESLTSGRGVPFKGIT